MDLNFLINSPKGGGAEKQFMELIDRFDYKLAFSLEKHGGAGSEKLVPLSVLGPEASPFLKFLSIGPCAKALAGKLKEKDLLVSFMTKSNLVNLKTAAETGHFSLICERTNPSREFSGLRKALYFPLIKKYYHKAGLIAVNSSGLGRELRENFGVPPEKIRLMRNHLNLENINLKKEEHPGKYAPLFENRVLINSGRLTEAKGQWRLLKLYSRLKIGEKDLKLVFLGDGELKDYLINLSESMGLKTYVENGKEFSNAAEVFFLGFQENPYKFLRRSSLFIFTSIWEGFPNALLEALACGLPVVSSDCDYGPAEMLSISPETSMSPGKKAFFSDFGVLLPELNRKRIKNPLEQPDETEKIWLETIKKILADRPMQERYSQLGEARAADFDIKKISGKWTTLFKEISDERNKRI